MEQQFAAERPYNVYFSSAKKQYIVKWREKGVQLSKCVPIHLSVDKSVVDRWVENWWKSKAIPNDTSSVKLTDVLKSEPFKSMEQTDTCMRLWFDKTLLASKPVESWTPADIIEWINWAASKGRAFNTVRNVLAFLRQAIAHARGMGWIKTPSNVVADEFVQLHMRRLKRKAPKIPIVALSKEDVDKLLSSELPDERRALYVVAVTSGLRSSELAGLTWKDVRDGKIFVTRQFQTRSGTVKPPKGGNERTVPGHDVALRTLSELKRKRNPKESDRIFLEANRSSVIFREDLSRAGCSITVKGRNVSFHALRRTFMTLLNEEDVERETIKRLAGHALNDVTSGHYVASDWKKMVDAIGKLGIGT